MATISGATTLTSIAKDTASLLGLPTDLFDIPTSPWAGTLPMPNPLSEYVTYNYVLSLSALSDNQVAHPDETYMAGEQTPLICKTAGADPSNRIQTPYGEFDFYIDNLTIDSVIGFEDNKNTNVGKLSFDVYEPYSMGIFMLSLQQAAVDAGHKNWLGAPFLITIDFQGNRQNGTMIPVPNLTRYIPFNLGQIDMSTSEKGTVYHVTGAAAVSPALTEENSTAKSDTSVKGKTVQEVLQTGEKSLQTIINKRLQQYKDDGLVEVPDEVIILFPMDVSSSPTASSAEKESTATATTNTTSTSSSSDVYKKLGVERNPTTKTLVQSSGKCNALGRASMGYSLKKKADVPISKDNAVYNTTTQVWDQSANTFDVKEGVLRFNQDIDIPTAINQVILSSSYPEYALSNGALDENGMRPMWRIDTQVFPISTEANYPKTGTKPRIIVYRVVPYRSHASKMTAPNVKAPGFDSIKNTVAKQYDYIYTGKNTEVLKFNIDFAPGFKTMLPADNFARSQDVQWMSKMASSLGKWIEDALGGFGGIINSIIGDAAGAASSISSALTGSSPSTDAGSLPSQVSPAGTKTSNDATGGGGLSTAVTQAAKYFYDAMTSEMNMVRLNLEILGDPFWINQSGLGNYTAKPTQYKDVNADGTVNYQNGEVDIVINFRTPIDINQATGLYNFGSSSKNAPAMQFSGIYQVSRVESVFSKGRFTQKLSGVRRPNQENKQEGSLSQLFSSDSIPGKILSELGNLFN